MKNFVKICLFVIPLIVTILSLLGMIYCATTQDKIPNVFFPMIFFFGMAIFFVGDLILSDKD